MELTVIGDGYKFYCVPIDLNKFRSNLNIFSSLSEEGIYDIFIFYILLSRLRQLMYLIPLSLLRKRLFLPNYNNVPLILLSIVPSVTKILTWFL